jgi:hypothetical protein
MSKGGGPERGVGTLERLEALVANPELFALGDAVPDRDPEAGGRPRQFPPYMWVLYDALLSVYGSARQVEAELAHPLVWGHLRRLIRRCLPDRPDLWLGEAPMRRHHYLYGRTRYLTHPIVLERLAELHRRFSLDQAGELGMLDPGGAGSFTHPELSRMFYADGKVLTPLFKAKPGETRVDRLTGEIKPRRFEADAGLHFEGTGETAWGTKWVLVAVRDETPRGRIIVEVAWVPAAGGEAEVAVDAFARLAPDAPGAQGIIYDTALRGVHHQRLLRELGFLSVNRVTAAVAAETKPRRSGGRWVEKLAFVENRTIKFRDGTARQIQLFAQGGAIGVGELTDTGELRFVELARVRTHRNADKNGRYRWYNDYRLPANLGGGTITVRLHGNDEDRRRRFNRTENVRPIPPTDPDFVRLYRRRNDAESINRALDDTLWLRRAHSIGHRRQQLNLLTYALVVNSIALYGRRATGDSPPLPLAG